jgi:hypothetical protein
MELTLSSPCPMSWEDLAGDDRVRYCEKCRLNVYNVAAMESQEVEALVRRTEGRLCGRLYWRGDRTASLRDCPSAAKRRVLRSIVATASVLFLAVFAVVFRHRERPDTRHLPPWLRDVAELIDPQPVPPRPAVVPPPPAVVGWLRRAKTPAPPAAPPSPTQSN